jgi:iron complex outermembrane receptor protein
MLAILLKYLRVTSNAALALVTMLATLVFGGVAHANMASDSASASSSVGLDEIVVTARRKTEKLQDVPLAVSAFSAEQLDNLGIIDQVTLSSFTPGFQFSDYTNGRSDRGAYRSMVFRGITSPGNTAVTADALAFLDGAPVTFNDILITDAIERVEVLKGPQNVYFGRSTFTGAVNYVTRNPGSPLKASTSIEVGNFNAFKFDGHIEGALISDKLTAGLDLQFSTKDGQYVNAAYPAEKFGGRKNQSVALTLYFTPTDALSVKLYGTHFLYDDGISNSIVIPSAYVLNCNPGGSGGTGKFFPCGKMPELQNAWIAQSNSYTALENQQLNHPAGGYSPLYNDCNHLGLCATTDGMHAITNYTLPWDGLKFQNITGYHKKKGADLANAVDQNVNNMPNTGFYGNPAYPKAPPYSQVFDYNIIDEIWDFSTEFRLSSADNQPLRWTFGSNYVHTVNSTNLWFYTSPTGEIPPNPNVGLTSVGARTVGIFGGVYYDPIPSVTLSAELRNQQDRREDVVASTGVALDKVFRSWSPRVSAQYKLNSDLNVYASYSAGVRPGGFNSIIYGLPTALKNQIAALVGTAPLAYDEEKLWQAEFGLKGDFLQNTVSTNIAVYTGKLTNQQTAQTAILLTPDPVYGGRFDLYTSNGSVDLYGLEADARWKASRVITLSATFAYNHTAEHNPNCFSCALITGSKVLDGQRLQDSPEVAGSLALDATDSLTANADWFAHIDYAYKGSIYIQQNGVNLSETGGANKVNAQIGIQNGNYSFAVWTTNLTDDKTYTGGQLSFDFLTFSPYGIRAGLPDRRAFGLRAKYSF